jgi:O-antigen/teichoic acid export membrane protein
MILALGEFLPMSQWVSYSMILGMGKHKPLAWMSLLENLTVVTLLLLLAPADLSGVCVAIAVPAMLCRGLYRLLYACRLVQVSLWRYLRHTFVPTLGVIIPGAAMVALTTSLYTPDSWPRLIAVGAAYSVVFWGVAAIGVFGWERCKEVVTW